MREKWQRIHSLKTDSQRAMSRLDMARCTMRGTLRQRPYHVVKVCSILHMHRRVEKGQEYLANDLTVGTSFSKKWHY